MGLEFSAEQEQVASLFTAYRNDIDIYTEDETKDKAFYKKLLSRLLEGSNVTISDVYPLGSSKDVVEACKKDTDTTRKKLYIVDGDIFILLTPKTPIENLFVLDSYCMENLVIDENAVCKTLCNRSGEMEYEDLKRNYNYNQLVDEHKVAIIDLFFHKALDKKYSDRFTLHSIAKYYDRENHLDHAKVAQEKDEIRNRLIANGSLTQEEFDAELLLLQREFPYTYETFHRIISGKDFLIPMIDYHARNILNIKAGYSKIAWKYNFCQHCSLDRLKPLRSAIIHAAQ